MEKEGMTLTKQEKEWLKKYRVKKTPQQRADDKITATKFCAKAACHQQKTCGFLNGTFATPCPNAQMWEAEYERRKNR